MSEFDDIIDCIKSEDNYEEKLKTDLEESINVFKNFINICNDGRFEIINKAKQDILKSTNIETSPDEMKVLDNFLFRCWQMGWLDKYKED